MSNDHIYEGFVEARERLNTADGLIEDAIGMLSDIMADDSTRDGEPPSGKEITRWAEQWLGEATNYLNGDK